ncbi:hypothetical protein ABVT39_004596 [Epinephelus coioides]
MSDHLTRGFRAQLTTSMDSILRRAVFEIMMIFENTLHDHKMEMAQKGQEIAQLKIKLQAAEIKLTECEHGGGTEAKMDKTQVIETQREPVDAPGQTPDVPEIDFEVPDDWCAPLGCETTNKPESNQCPSVRLRKLSIPLWPIPDVKKEVVNYHIKSRQQAKGLRRSRRCSSLNKKLKQTEDRTLPVHDQGIPRRPMRNDINRLLRDIKQEYIDLTSSTGLRRLRNSTGKEKEQENTTKTKREERKLAATESTENETVKNVNVKKYTCKFCKKVFDTEFGRSVHVRSHKRCRGCKKGFPFPSALRLHKTTCQKLKKLLEAEVTNPPKPDSSEEKPAAPSKEQAIVKWSAPSTSNHSESSIQKDESTKKNLCVHCNKTFDKPWALQQHIRVHTGERPYPCGICPKKFSVKQSRKKHILTVHKNQTKSCETNENLEWTKPLEDTEEIPEDMTPPRKDKSPAIKHNGVKKDGVPDIKPRSEWQTMGTRCSEGFLCSFCHKVLKNKCRLIEHFRIHTGEKPMACDSCPATFRFRGQLSMHKKRCHTAVLNNQCAKCQKQFSSLLRYNGHVSKCHRDKPKFCKVCGKCFYTKGRLRNHMEQVHP